MNEQGVITGVSVAHDTAKIDEIGAAGGDSVRATVSDLLARQGVSEAFAIRTCNRSEAYVVTDTPGDGHVALDSFAPSIRGAAVQRFDHEESLRHLMRVAAGLESLVLGEDQIIGQVRDAYEEARSAGGIGPVLTDAVTKAIHVGERARTETEINEGVVSLGSAAVRLAAGETDLDAATAVVVGAGEMGMLAARTLDETSVGEIVIANRTVSNAEFVAEEVETTARVCGLGELRAAVADAALVITATSSPDHVLGPADFENTDDVVCIDIAHPRDIDPAVGSLDGVSAYDIDALEDVTEQTRERRESAARAVESIVDEEVDRILKSFKRKRADDAISAMYAGAEQVKATELDRALTKLKSQGGLTTAQEETIEALADSLVGQLLAAPTRSLRDAAGEDDWETIQTALTLFDPEFDAPPETPGDTEQAMPAGVSFGGGAGPGPAPGPSSSGDPPSEELDD